MKILSKVVKTCDDFDEFWKSDEFIDEWTDEWTDERTGELLNECFMKFIVLDSAPFTTCIGAVGLWKIYGGGKGGAQGKKIYL